MDENQVTHPRPHRVPAELLDVHAVADMLSVPHGRVYQFAYVGTIPAPVKLGGLVRWSGRELLRWIDAGCRPAHASESESKNEDGPRLPPSRVKARAAYEWALKNIPGAGKLTRQKLFDAIRASELPPDLRDSMPPNAVAFQKYINDAGVRKQVHRTATSHAAEVATNSSEAPQ